MNSVKSLNLLSIIPAFSREDQLSLVKQAQQGDEEAKVQLFQSLNALIVQKLCKRYLILPHFWQDAIFATYPEFEKALERFEIKRGWKFSTYAFYYLRNGFMSWMRRQSSVRLPVKQCQLLAKLERYLDLTIRESRFPWHVSSDLIRRFCESTGYEQGTVEELVRSRRVFNVESRANTRDDAEEQTELFLEKPLYSPEYLRDRPVEMEALRILRKEALEHAMDECLSSRERQNLELRFGLSGHIPCSHREIGVKMGNTKQAAFSSERRALKKVRIFFLENYPDLCFAT
ncbi:MAG: sigma-70 family RNA polymerase sigma factor [Patescibacteria group bacterium]|nr:sigma-70 family RNA polymerase sigma factor [Patescibacteria group bacterium]